MTTLAGAPWNVAVPRNVGVAPAGGCTFVTQRSGRTFGAASEHVAGSVLGVLGCVATSGASAARGARSAAWTRRLSTSGSEISPKPTGARLVSVPADAEARLAD